MQAYLKLFIHSVLLGKIYILLTYQEGQPGSKTITTPITVNPLTGEKVGEGQPTEEITKQPVDKIVEFGGETTIICTLKTR
ncbi:hypothetical protein E1952_15040 [Staphylococcus aureus]|nr:hypothetical protein E1952_15040 [Staphylococcus aureus]